MRISRAAAVAGLLALAVAGCSSDSDPASGAPDPAALASSIAAQATSPAAAPSSAGSSAGNRAVGNCTDGQLSAQAALSATIASDVSLPDGCASLSVTVPDDTEAAVGQSVCSTAASEAFRYGIAGVVVVTTSGTTLATGTAPSIECTVAG